MSYFPMFVNIAGMDCLVVGGGETAFQKTKVLLDFGAEVTVIAPEICGQIQEIKAECVYSAFSESALCGRDIVIAATDDRELNHVISKLCRERNISVNAVDQPEDCDFIFPAYVKRGEVVTAVSSGGSSPMLAQRIKMLINNILPDNIGDMARILKDVRPYIKERLPAKKRREAYCKILDEYMKSGELIQSGQIEEIINTLQEKSG